MDCRQQVRHCAHVPGSGERVAWRAWVWLTGRVNFACVFSLLQQHAVVRAMLWSSCLLSILEGAAASLLLRSGVWSRMRQVAQFFWWFPTARFTKETNAALECCICVPRWLSTAGAIVVVCDLVCHICCCVCFIMYATFTLLLPAGAAGLI
jgi:hypothetical protein